MSRFQSTRRRLSLLASSSLVAASLTAAMSMGIALAPTAAFAANECTPVGVDPSANAAADDSYICDASTDTAAGTYDSGITYSSDGDLAVVAATPLEVYGEGVTLTGNGADSVTFDTQFNPVNSYEETAAAINVSSVGGAITVTAEGGVTSVNRSGTHGIQALSGGTGSADGLVSIIGNYVFGNSGIEAVNAGDVAVRAFGVYAFDIDGVSQPGTYGVRAVSTEADVTVRGSEIYGFIGIDAMADGDVTISNSEGIYGGGFGGAGGPLGTYGIRAASSGGGHVNIRANGVYGATGIDATSAGDISIMSFYVFGVDASGFSSSEGMYGLRAETSGGDISIGGDGFTGYVGIEAINAGDGAISINVNNIVGLDADGFNGPGTFGIRAVSSGDGPIGIRAGGGRAGTAIYAEGAGGGDVTVTTVGRTTYSERGVYAETTGDGALTINIDSVIESTEGSTVARGVVALTEQGPLTITVTDFVNGFLSGIQTSAGGDTLIDIAAGGSVGTFATGATLPGWALDLGAGAGTTVVNNDGNVGSIRASGAGELLIEHDGQMNGVVDFSALAGGATMNIGEAGRWRLVPVADAFDFGSGEEPILQQSFFSPGDDVLTSAGQIRTGRVVDRTTTSPSTIVDFGGGADRFENTGTLVVHPHGESLVSIRDVASDTVFSNLETFVNSGVIYLGARAAGNLPETVNILLSDEWYDDVLSMPGAHWIGEDGEVILNVDLNRTQTDCTTRNTAGDLQAADCISLVGGSTSGRTFITVIETVPGDRGAYDPEGILIVDVSGGEGHQGDFVIGPNTPGYSEAGGGALDKGIFFYTIAYNEDDQKFRLVGLPGANAGQFPLLAEAGLSLWRTSTGTWFDRQADLRGTLHEGVGGGPWLRISGENSDRDVIQTFEGGGQTFSLDNSLRQKTYAVTGGADIFSGGEGDTAYVFGVMAGYANAKLDYKVSPNQAQFDGWTGGVYASFISGGLFIDAAVNANRLDMKDDVPALNLFPAGTILRTNLMSYGAQAEAGWRFPLGGGLFVEPLAAVSYVRSEYDDILVPADDPARDRIGVAFDDPTSLRAGIGGRVGLDLDHGGFRTQISILGRRWNEFEGENAVILDNAGPDALLVDDFSGQFSEFGFGGGIYSESGLVSGVVNIGRKFGNDYEGATASAAVRFNW